MAFDEPLIYAIAIVGAIISCSIVLYAMKKRGKREEELAKEEDLKTEFKSLPLKIAKSVSREEAGRARDELRILDLEREILSDAIRRLYEAHAEGKISEEERERLAQ